MSGVDRFRPTYHFSPPASWLNDPNGCIYRNGEYHLFYQHHPDSDLWGPMHWGHAVSDDLITWRHLPIALYPDEHGAIFSGSAVIDGENTSNLGPGTMIALFTHSAEDSQVQSLAYSTDSVSWTKHPQNPLVVPPDGQFDFRDPRVIPFGDGWVMALSAGDHVEIYASRDLILWQKQSEFRDEGVSRLGIWEMPDLIEFGDRWALVLGIMSGAPAGGCGSIYWTGDFDGHRFAPDRHDARWVDHGADFYASQTFSHAPGDDPVWIAWLGNWAYARSTPSDGWRGIMSIPRTIKLSERDGVPTITQQPVAALASIKQLLRSVDRVEIDGPMDLLSGIDLASCEIGFTIDVATSSSAVVQLAVRCGADDRTLITYDIGRSQLSIDRSRSGADVVPTEGLDSPFAEFGRHSFGDVQTVDCSPVDGLVDLIVLVDRSSVEVFAMGGAIVFSNQIFPDPSSSGLSLIAVDGMAVVRDLVVYRLEPVAGVATNHDGDWST